MHRLLQARKLFVRCASTKTRASEFYSYIQQFNSIVASEKTSFEKAQDSSQWFEKLRESKFHINLDTYVKLIQVLANDRRLSACLKIYNFMKKTGVKPNEVMIQTLIHACSRAKKSDNQQEHYVEHAKRILFQDRVKWKIPANIVMYNEFIKTCINVNDVENGYAIFRKLVDADRTIKKKTKKEQELKIVEDEDGNESVVREEKAEQEEWQDKLPYPDEFTFTMMIQLLAKNIGTSTPSLGKITLETCFAILDEMSKFPKLKKDAHVYASLMKAVMIQDAEHPQMVIELYKQMLQKDEIRPTAHIMMIVLSAAKKMTPKEGGNKDMILNIHKEMKAQKVVSDSDLLNHVCCALAQYGFYDEALQMFKNDFRQRLVQIHPITFYTLLHHGFKRYSTKDVGDPKWFELHVESILFKMLEQDSPLPLERLVSYLLKNRRLMQFVYPLVKFVSEKKLKVQYVDDRRWLSHETMKELHEKFAKRPEYKEVIGIIK